jgi:hypothetical protein
MRLKEHVKIKWEINFFNTKFQELNKKTEDKYKKRQKKSTMQK